MVEKSNVKILLNQVANEALVRSYEPDRLILATGSSARKLNVLGNERLTDCLEAIDKQVETKGQIVIIGGGSIGCELALEYAQAGNQVTIVEMGKELALNGNMLYRTALHQHIKKESHITVYLKSQLREISEDRVYLQTPDGETVLAYDQVVNAAGRIPNKAAAFSLYGITPDTCMVGDCERVGALVDAINLAYFIGHTC